MLDAGLLVYLRDVTSTGGIATLDCAIVELQLNGRHLAHGGSGTHPDARVAATRALTEAAQSRIAHHSRLPGALRPWPAGAAPRSTAAG